MSNQLGTVEPRYIADLVSVDVTRADTTAVSVDEAKSWARIDEDFDDSIVEMLTDGADKAFESFTGKLLFVGTVIAEYDPKEFESILQLPWLPVDSITSVKDEDDEDVDYELKGDHLEVDVFEELTVTYEAGLYSTASEVDAQLKLGLLKWIATNYDDREDTVIGTTIETMPNESRKQWIPFKEYTV